MPEERAEYRTETGRPPNGNGSAPADDPLLTTEQAAARMGKTYRQFTAYASHHRLPREGDPPLYRLSVIELHAKQSRDRQKPSRLPVMRQDQPAPPALAEQTQILATYVERLTALTAKTDELHERLHQQEREAREREDRLRAEHEQRVRDLQAIIEIERQKAETERVRREEAEKAAKAEPWWRFGRRR
jgi:hypothetical protein